MKRKVQVLSIVLIVMAAMFLEMPHRSHVTPNPSPYADMYLPAPATEPTAFQIPSGTYSPFSIGGLELMAQVPPIPSATAVTAYATSTGAGAQTMLAAPAGASVRNYIYQVSCVNTSASTQSALLIKSGATTLAMVGCPPASTNQGVMNFNPPLRQPDVATAVTATPVAAATTLYMYMSGFTAR